MFLFSSFQQSLERLIKFSFLLVSKPNPPLSFGLQMLFHEIQVIFFLSFWLFHRKLLQMESSVFVRAAGKFSMCIKYLGMACIVEPTNTTLPALESDLAFQADNFCEIFSMTKLSLFFDGFL